MIRTSIHWFRRDFRIRDNLGLITAARDADAVIGVFVIDPRWFGPNTGKIGPHQAKFWLDSLLELEHALAARNIRLVIRTHSDPVNAVLNIAREAGAATITFNKEYEPQQMAMDDRLEHEAQVAGIVAKGVKDAVIFEEEELLTGKETPYTIFTPYKNAYLKKLANAVEVQGLVRKLPTMKHVPSEGVPTLKKLGFEDVALDIHPGEGAGTKMLEKFCEKGIADYAQTRDIPALGLEGKGTSRLSAHLNAGTVSIRQAMRAALECIPSNAGISTWISELIWRDFYRMILFHFPDTVSKAFRKNYDPISWRNDPALIAAWCEGRTGYPLVDAAMKQLRTTGFMHNRLRMIAAMFLTKDLDVHWIIGERFFMRWLIDYDQACNVGGWQWAASTGTDAAPYFRVMNPVLQSLRFDPEAAFIKHYLPALANVPTKYVHAPWEMPTAMQAEAKCMIGKDYPAPVVDHAKAKELAIAKFRTRRV